MTIFNKKWTIINLSNRLSDLRVRECIESSGIPSCVTFVFEDKPFEVIPWAESFWPWGMEPWTIIVSDFDDVRFPKNGVNFLGGALGNRCTVAYVAEYDFPLQLGARIWHEMLHCMDVDSDQMDGKDRTGFCEWVNSNPSKLSKERKELSIAWCNGVEIILPNEFNEVLAAYYTYLMYINFQHCFRKTIDVASIIRRILEIIKKIFGV